MIAEVKVPEVGESVTEGVLVEWNVADGDQVSADDELLVLETDKITVTVNAERAGRIQLLVEAGETVEVGQVVAKIDTDAAGESRADVGREADAEGDAEGSAEPAAAPSPARGPQETAGEDTDTSRDDGPPISPPAGPGQAADKLSGDHQLSPAVRRLVAEHDLDPNSITGTGKGGRLTKGDVLRHLESSAGEAEAGAQTTPAMATPSPPESRSEQPRPEARPSSGAGGRDERQTREQMSSLRQRLAERLVSVQQNSAILTTFNEVDMSRVMALRAEYKDRFERRHGVRLGFMSFFVKAVVDALKTVPAVNGFIDGDEIVRNHYYDIGVAVSSDKGLVVPVVRDCDCKSLADLEREIGELAERARDRKLELRDLQGGVFTISNGGVFGSLLSTPILNPPQSAILGMHTIQKRAVVVDDEIVIRPMMYLALSYDHRLIDGREAVTFLKRIAECVGDPDRMLLEV